MMMRKVNGSKCLGLFLMTTTLIAVILMGCGGGGGGDGTSGTTRELSISETQLDYGDVVIGSFSDRTITLESTGTSGVTFGQIPKLTAPFTILEENCSGRGMSPSGTCTLKVRFSPSEQGSFSGNINIPCDAGIGNSPINLSGTGKGLNVSINRIDTQACASDQIELLVSVADREGNAKTDLDSTHFTLFENGQAIDTFEVDASISTLPISVGLVLDYSSSMIPYTEDLKAAAIDFIGRLASEDEAEVIKFAEEIKVAQPYTTDKTLLTQAVNADFGARPRGTSLHDALWMSVDHTALRTNTRRAVIVVSDGSDTRSTHTLDELIAHAVDKGIPVFTVGIGEVNAGLMQRLAAGTGGQYFLATDSASLQSVYSQISEVLSNQYLIKYDSASCGQNTVVVDVEVEDDAGYMGAASRSFSAQ